MTRKMFVFGGGICMVLVLLWMTESTSAAKDPRHWTLRPSSLVRPAFLTERPPYIWPPSVAEVPVPEYLQSYCRSRPGALQNQCCRHRQDECSIPYYDTLCYCDEFCDRRETKDCCPDYFTFCRNEIPPPKFEIGCHFNGLYYTVLDVIKLNCNQCTCTRKNSTFAEMVCDDQVCLIRPNVTEEINQGNYGWTAGNYSFFWGKTLDGGYKQRLGTCRLEKPWDQYSIHKIKNGHVPKAEFDARHKWPGQIQPIRDQHDFPSSWAISTVDLAADRLAIQSHGLELMSLSAQHLISCVSNRRHDCDSGAIVRAWWHLNRYGVVSEDCYPYTSAFTNSKGKCLVSRNEKAETSKCPNSGHESMIYRTPPAYRVNYKEEDIMMEIQTYGPVQATLRVKSDFFMYKSGVYRYTKLNPEHETYHYSPFQAVRIIGWGVDRSHGTPIKYWLCANSWGTQWGENGYFRILRGEDECDIESYVVGVWATKNNHNSHNNFIPNHINEQ